MKRFERVMEKVFGNSSKLKTPVSLVSTRKSKSSEDHLYRPYQIVIDSFYWGEHVGVAFLDVEEAFDNISHNGFRT